MLFVAGCCGAYCGDDDNGNSLLVRTRFYRGRMPDTMIPIGHDLGSGLICLGVKGRENAKVYYWDQANEAPSEKGYLRAYGTPRPPEALFDNVTQVAKSFEDFIHRLRFSPDPD